MIRLAFPLALGMALVASVGVALLHLLSVREPPARALPTARFVPDGPSRAVARQPRPSDRRLLLLRLLALLACGAAFSGIRCHAASRTVVDLAYVPPSLLGDSLQWMPAVRRDSAELIVTPVADLAEDPGGALVQALRDASVLATREEPLEEIGLVVVVPPTIRSARGWQAWRPQWPAQVRVQVHGAVADTRWRVRVLGGGADDPVRAAFAGRTSSRIGADARVDTALARLIDIVRDTIARPREDESADVLVLWPESGVPSGWAALDRGDTVGAVAAGGVALVGPFARRARLGTRLNNSTVRPIVWWGDGDVAAIERHMDGRCVREVALSIPSATDLLLSPSARGVLDAVQGPCDGRVPSSMLLASIDTSMKASPPRAPAAAFRQAMSHTVRSDPWWLAPLLLCLGFVALGAEWWWRRRTVVA